MKVRKPMPPLTNKVLILESLEPHRLPPGSENLPVVGGTLEDEIAPMLAVFRQLPAAERRAVLRKLLAELDPPSADGAA